jgi:hypothetical protein
MSRLMAYLPMVTPGLNPDCCRISETGKAHLVPQAPRAKSRRLWAERLLAHHAQVWDEFSNGLLRFMGEEFRQRLSPLAELLRPPFTRQKRSTVEVGHLFEFYKEDLLVGVAAN